MSYSIEQTMSTNYIEWPYNNKYYYWALGLQNVTISAFIFLQTKNVWTGKVNKELTTKSTKNFSLVPNMRSCLCIIYTALVIA